MPDHTRIYKEKAKVYDQLVSKQPSVASILQKIRPWQGLNIVDLGAGTGRLACQLGSEACFVIALDQSSAMLEVTAEKLGKMGLDNWQVQVADHRSLPVEDDWADLIVSGWSICYLASSNNPDWRQNLEQVMTEIARVLKPDGTMVIFETMGTGTEKPTPPDFLQNYYSILEKEYYFAHTLVRTDYDFTHIDEAEELTRFFFGSELADQVKEKNRVHLPEWAGVWWRNF